MGFGEQWRLRSRVNLSWKGTSLGSFSEGLAPLLTDPPMFSSLNPTKLSECLLSGNPANCRWNERISEALIRRSSEWTFGRTLR
jgi:hypothetical protein